LLQPNYTPRLAECQAPDQFRRPTKLMRQTSSASPAAPSIVFACGVDERPMMVIIGMTLVLAPAIVGGLIVAAYLDRI
jgi:hypothetical protein